MLRRNEAFIHKISLGAIRAMINVCICYTQSGESGGTIGSGAWVGTEEAAETYQWIPLSVIMDTCGGPDRVFEKKTLSFRSHKNLNFCSRLCMKTPSK